MISNLLAPGILDLSKESPDRPKQTKYQLNYTSGICGSYET